MDSAAESDGLVRQIVLLELANFGPYIIANVCSDPAYFVIFSVVGRQHLLQSALAMPGPLLSSDNK